MQYRIPFYLLLRELQDAASERLGIAHVVHNTIEANTHHATLLAHAVQSHVGFINLKADFFPGICHVHLRKPYHLLPYF